MYVPGHFEETRTDRLHTIMRAHPFATLITSGSAGLEANHLPLILADEPAPLGTLRGHLARANPVWRELEPEAEALVIFQGPQAYVSPDWYPSKHATGRAVPTWNYAVVHARGRLRIVDDAEWLRGHVESLTRQQERGRETPWAVSDAPEAFIAGMTRAIVGVEISLRELVGKWKLSQNRPVADRQGVVEGLARESGDAGAAVADLMRDRLS